MNIDRRQLLGSAAALAGASALSAPAFAADPIKVGSLHDLSGGLDIYGKPMVDALTLAIEEANAAGGLLGRKLPLGKYHTPTSMALFTPVAPPRERSSDRYSTSSRRSISTTHNMKGACATVTNSTPA